MPESAETRPPALCSRAVAPSRSTTRTGSRLLTTTTSAAPAALSPPPVARVLTGAVRAGAPGARRRRGPLCNTPSGALFPSAVRAEPRPTVPRGSVRRAHAGSPAARGCAAARTGDEVNRSWSASRCIACRCCDAVSGGCGSGVAPCGAQPVEREREVAPPELRRDVARRVDDARARPEEHRDVLVDDVRPQRARRLRALDQLLHERRPQPARARAASSFSSRRWTATIAAKPRFSACSATVRSRKPASPRQGSSSRSASSASAARRSRCSSKIASTSAALRREAAVERAHADAGAARDLVDRHARARARRTPRAPRRGSRSRLASASRRRGRCRIGSKRSARSAYGRCPAGHGASSDRSAAVTARPDTRRARARAAPRTRCSSRSSCRRSPVLQHDLNTSASGRRVDLHRVPARGLGGDADRRPPRRHVRQEARARDRARRPRRSASLLAALVSTLALMIVARVIQGLGGAIFPLAFGIIRDEFPPRARRRRDRA